MISFSGECWQYTYTQKKDNNIKECVQCITIEDYQSIKNKRCLTKILELDVKGI